MTKENCVAVLLIWNPFQDHSTRYAWQHSCGKCPELAESRSRLWVATQSLLSCLPQSSSSLQRELLQFTSCSLKASRSRGTNLSPYHLILLHPFKQNRKCWTCWGRGALPVCSTVNGLFKETTPCRYVCLACFLFFFLQEVLPVGVGKRIVLDHTHRSSPPSWGAWICASIVGGANLSSPIWATAMLPRGRWIPLSLGCAAATLQPWAGYGVGWLACLFQFRVRIVPWGRICNQNHTMIRLLLTLIS